MIPPLLAHEFLPLGHRVQQHFSSVRGRVNLAIDRSTMESEPGRNVETEHESLNLNLAQRALHAAKWNYLGVAARIAIQLAAQVVLARFVGPSEFGYYSLVFMAVGIAYLLAEFGLSSALVQSRNLTAVDIRRVWSHLLASGLLASLTMILLADSIGTLMRLPAAAEYLRWAAVPLVIQLLSSVALALLRKNLDFKRIQVAQISGMLIGQVGVGLFLAWILHSAFAILIGWTVQLAVAWGIMYWKVRHHLVPSISSVGIGLSRFGFGAWAVNLANWGIENLHMLLAGRIFGAETLGLYSVSSNLVRYPTNHLVTTLQAVIFPASAAAQDDHKALRVAYLAIFALVALITVPLFVAVAVLAEPLILLLYGQAWGGAAELMQPLALAMPLQAVTAVSGPILWGTGRVGREAALQWLTMVSFVTIIYAAGLVSPVKLAWIVLVVYGLRVCLISGAVASMLKISPWRMITQTRGAIVLGVVSCASALSGQHAIGAISPTGSIAVIIIFTSCVSFALLWFAPAIVITQPLARAITLMGTRLPASFMTRIELLANRRILN